MTRPSDPIRIAVVVPHLNQPDALARCLASLLGGRRPPDEVVVVDNGSEMLPTAVIDAHPGVRLEVEPTPGPGLARNAGVATTTAPVLAFIDSDCVADPAWLEVAEREMRDPGAAILGGEVAISVADARDPTPVEAYESVYAFRVDRYIREQGFTVTANLVVRRDVLDRVGPFGGLDVAEDRDWGRRATALGFAIRYVPDMIVRHPARAGLPEIRAKWDRLLAHDFAEARRGRLGRLRFAVKMAGLALSPPVEALRILRSDRLQGAAARRRGMGAMAAVRWHRAARMAWLLAGGDPARLAGAWNRPTTPPGRPGPVQAGTSRSSASSADS